MYGSLTVVTGSMFAGKTTYLIDAAENADAIVFKPKMDIRYSTDSCVSHDGRSIPATPIFLPDDLVVAEGKKLICFDEIQFFTNPYYCGDIVRAIKVFLKVGKDVLVTGLDADWKGNPFRTTSDLLAMADKVLKLTAKCGVCSAPASKTLKKSRHGAIFELGSADSYEARRNRHWTPTD